MALTIKLWTLFISFSLFAGEHPTKEKPSPKLETAPTKKLYLNSDVKQVSPIKNKQIKLKRLNFEASL